MIDHQPLPVLPLRQVRGHRDGPASGAGHRLDRLGQRALEPAVTRLLGPGGDGHRGALLGQSPGDGVADAAAGARDDGDAIGKLHVRLPRARTGLRSAPHYR